MKNTLTDEIRIESAILDARLLNDDFNFAVDNARRLNEESDCYIHPVAGELLKPVSFARRIIISRAASFLTPRSFSYDDLTKYFDIISERLTGGAL
jgi:hypothetical protein